MKPAFLFIFLLISGYSFSQKNDSIPKKKLKSFFGCECCQDTVKINAAYKHKWIYECTLYKSQYLLTASKKGKVIWKVDLKKDFECAKGDAFCIFDGISDKKGNELIIVSDHCSKPVVLYLKNEKQVKQSKK